MTYDEVLKEWKALQREANAVFLDYGLPPRNIEGAKDIYSRLSICSSKLSKLLVYIKYIRMSQSKRRELETWMNIDKKEWDARAESQRISALDMEKNGEN